MEKNRKKFKMPGAVVVLVILLVIMSLLTYVIPAGEYDRVEVSEGREMVDPNSFHNIESSPTTLLQFLTSIPRGFVESAAVIAFTLIIAGAFEVIKNAGLLNVMVSKLSSKFSKNGIVIIPVLMVVFSLIAAFVGTPELSMIYVPIILPLLVSLGFDAMTSVAIPLVGTVIGFTAAFTNPFTVGIAHQISGLPMFSGMWYRIIVYIILVPIGSWYIMRYAKSIQKDPEISMKEARESGVLQGGSQVSEDIEFTGRQKLISLVFLLIFGYMVYGVLTMGWGMVEMAGVFTGIGILSGIIAGMESNEIADAFVNGAKGVLAGGILIGVARGVSVIMTDARILDTVVFYLAQALEALPGSLNAIGIFIIQTFFNFLVPSGSGKALVTMPIISPLADLVGLNQQVAVLAFQFGDGLTNIFWPTSGYFMATLAVARVEWTDWIKFYTRLLLILSAICAVLLIIAQAIDYGPF